MRKIRIVVFELQKSLGGIETFLINLYQYIDREKFQLDFVTSVQDIHELPYLDKLKGAQIYTIASIKNPIKYIKDINGIFNNGYDIAHFNKNSAANILPIYLAERNSNVAKIVVHSHNTNPSLNNKLLNLLHLINRSYIDKNSDKVLACSTEAARWLFSDRKAEIIENGIVTTDFLFSLRKRKQVRRKYGISEKNRVVGYVGRFTHQKNLHLLIKVFCELYKENSEFRLLLVGDGPELESLKKQVQTFGLSDKVIFAGRQTAVADYLSAMDYFVMTSFYEGLPISCVEAQASGLKVIISDKITKEVQILSNVKTFSINQSPKKIATNILNVKIPQCFERIDNNKKVLKKYDVKKMVDSMEKVYSSLID